MGWDAEKVGKVDQPDFVSRGLFQSLVNQDEIRTSLARLDTDHFRKPQDDLEDNVGIGNQSSRVQ